MYKRQRFHRSRVPPEVADFVGGVLEYIFIECSGTEHNEIFTAVPDVYKRQVQHDRAFQPVDGDALLRQGISPEMARRYHSPYEGVEGIGIVLSLIHI